MGVATLGACALVCKPVIDEVTRILFPPRVPEPPPDPFGDDPGAGEP